jgi:hypothetical protein
MDWLLRIFDDKTRANIGRMPVVTFLKGLLNPNIIHFFDTARRRHRYAIFLALMP